MVVVGGGGCQVGQVPLGLSVSSLPTHSGSIYVTLLGYLHVETL